MSEITNQILRELTDLSSEDQGRVREYISFLRWRANQGPRQPLAGAARPWQYNLLENFRSGHVRASGSKAGHGSQGSRSERRR